MRNVPTTPEDERSCRFGIKKTWETLSTHEGSAVAEIACRLNNIRSYPGRRRHSIASITRILSFPRRKRLFPQIR
jgi:hypothetical protein